MDFGPNTEADTYNYLNLVQRLQREKPRMSFELGMTLQEDPETVLGGVGVRIQSQDHRVADMGYILRKDQWGNGFGTEMATWAIAFAFNDLNMNRVWATADIRNTASQRVLEKIGMQREAHLRQDKFVRGAFRDSYLYAILREDFIKED